MESEIGKDCTFMFFVLIKITSSHKGEKAGRGVVSVTTPSQERLKRIAIAAGKDIDVVQSDYIEAVDEHALASGDDSAQENHEYLTDEGYQQEEENELRRTVQAVFELEEALLNQHMSNIQVECCIPYACFSIIAR